MTSPIVRFSPLAESEDEASGSLAAQPPRASAKTKPPVIAMNFLGIFNLISLDRWTDKRESRTLVYLHARGFFERIWE